MAEYVLHSLRIRGVTFLSPRRLRTVSYREKGDAGMMHIRASKPTR